MTIDATNLCSHLQKKLLEPDGMYQRIWQAIQSDDTLSAVVRSRQLHIYRNGKKEAYPNLTSAEFEKLITEQIQGL